MIVDALISRVRMHDLACLGRSRTGTGPQAGLWPARPLHGVKSSPRPYGYRQRLAAAAQSGQVAPRTCDLRTSPI